MQSALSCSGRKAAYWLRFNRSSLRYRPKSRSAKQQQLEAMILKFSREHPRLGAKKVSGLLRSHGYRVNRKIVQRVRREEELQVSQLRPRLRRQSLSTGLPQRATHRNHVWFWDFVSGHTQRGGALRCFNLIDESKQSADEI